MSFSIIASDACNVNGYQGAADVTGTNTDAAATGRQSLVTLLLLVYSMKPFFFYDFRRWLCMYCGQWRHCCPGITIFFAGCGGLNCLC